MDDLKTPAPAATGDGRQLPTGTNKSNTTRAAAPYGPHLVEKMLARLEKVRPMGRDRWMACCPAHDDRSPSLSVRHTADKVLFHCFAGCDSEDILAAIGLTWRDLFSRDWKADTARGVALAGREYSQKPLDPVELDRRVLRIAKADMAAGKILSAEDRARVELALERMEAADGR